MDETLAVDVAWLTLLLSLVIPIAVGFVTKKVADSSVKAVILLFLSAATAVLNQAVLDEGVFKKETVVVAVTSFVIATATHYGFLKPVHVTGSEGVVQTKTANVGIG
jgi:hypothetical protein